MRFEQLVRFQDGVVTMPQAVACGWSRHTVARRVRTGGWERLHPGVYLVGGHRRSARALVRAAWLWAGPDALVAGPTAAFWHGLLPGPAGPAELILPPGTGGRSRPGLRVRRTAVPDADRAAVHGVAVTGLARTVLDAAIVLPDGAAFLDRALQRHVGLPEVRRTYHRMLGRTGSAAMSRMLIAAGDGAASGAERILLALLRRAGITGWVVAHPVDGGIIDVAFPARRIAIEFDGWAFHSDVERFRRDRRKGNALVTAGWTLLRFTWHDLTRDPDRVLHEIRTALARAA